MARKIGERRVSMKQPASLIYKGQPDNGPEELEWIINLLRGIFNGREIMTNACEGTFGNMGTLIRPGRSIVL